MPISRFDRIDPQMRAAILEAARAEFAEHGYESSSYNRIIANSRLSKSSFYYYFHGKEDLYVTVVKDAIARFAEAVGEPREVNTAKAFWSECARLLRLFYHAGLKNPLLIGVLRSVLELKPGQMAEDLMAQITLKDVRWYEGIIQRGQALGAVRTDVPLDLIIEVYLAVLVARVKWSMKQLLDGAPLDIEEDVADIIDLLRRMAAPAKAKKKKARK